MCVCASQGVCLELVLMVLVDEENPCMHGRRRLKKYSAAVRIAAIASCARTEEGEKRPQERGSYHHIPPIILQYYRDSLPRHSLDVIYFSDFAT